MQKKKKREKERKKKRTLHAIVELYLELSIYILNSRPCSRADS